MNNNYRENFIIFFGVHPRSDFTKSCGWNQFYKVLDGVNLSKGISNLAALTEEEL